MAPDRTQLVTMLTLLLVIPVALFVLDRSTLFVVALSVPCVLLITGSLYVMFGPVEDSHATNTA